jgi:hypothetical protein
MTETNCIQRTAFFKITSSLHFRQIKYYRRFSLTTGGLHIGRPDFQLTQDPLDYESRTCHSSKDVFERVPGKDVKKATGVMIFFAYKAAMMDSLFPRDYQ